MDFRKILQKTMDLKDSKPFFPAFVLVHPMPQDLGIARATFLPLTLHEAQ